MARKVYSSVSSSSFSTTSTTYTDVASLTFTPADNETYFIFWHCLANGPNTQNYNVRVWNGSTVFGEASAEAVSTTDQLPTFGLTQVSFGTNPGSRTYTLQLMSEAGSAVFVRDVEIIAVQAVTGDGYYTNTGNSSSSSTTYATAISANLSVSSTSDYLIVACGECDVNSAPNDTGFRIQVDGATKFEGAQSHRDSTEWAPVGGLFAMSLTVGTRVITVANNTNVSQSSTLRNTRLAALCLANDEHSFNSNTTFASTTSSAAFSTRASITVTDAAPGDHLVFAGYFAGVNATSEGPQINLFEDATADTALTTTDIVSLSKNGVASTTRGHPLGWSVSRRTYTNTSNGADRTWSVRFKTRSGTNSTWLDESHIVRIAVPQSEDHSGSASVSCTTAVFIGSAYGTGAFSSGFSSGFSAYQPQVSNSPFKDARLSVLLPYTLSVSSAIRPEFIGSAVLNYSHSVSAIPSPGVRVNANISSDINVQADVRREARVALPLFSHTASVVASSDQSVFALVTLPYTVAPSADGKKEALVQISLNHETEEEISVESSYQVQASVIALSHDVQADGSAQEVVSVVAVIEYLSETEASVTKEARVVPTTAAYSTTVPAVVVPGAEVSTTLSSTVLTAAQAIPEARVAVSLLYTHSIQADANVDKRVMAVSSHTHAIEAFYSLEEKITAVASTSIGTVSATAEILPEARVSPSLSYSHSTDTVVDIARTVTAVVSANQNVTASYSLNETTVATAFTNAGSVSISALVRPEARTGVTISNSLAVSATVRKGVHLQPLLDYEFQQTAQVTTEHLVEIPPVVLNQQITAAFSGEGEAEGTAFLSHDVLNLYVGEGKFGGFGNGFSSGFPAHEPGIGGFKDVFVETTFSGSVAATAQTSSEARVSLTVPSLQSVEAEIEVAKEVEAVIGASQAVTAFYVLGETTTAHASVNVGSVSVSAEVRSESRASVAVAASVSVSANIGTERQSDVDIVAHTVSASASGSADESIQSVALIEHDVSVNATFTKRVESGASLLLSESQSVAVRTERLNSAAIVLTAETQAAGIAEGTGSASSVIGLTQQIQTNATKAVGAEATVPHIVSIVLGSHTAVGGTAQFSHGLTVSASGMRGFSTSASVGITVDIDALVGKTAHVPTTTAYATASSAAGVKSTRLSISATAIASVVGEISVEKRAAALDQALDSVQAAFHTERFSDASTALLLSGYAQGVTVPPDLMLGKIPISGTSDAVYDLTGQVTSVVSLIGIANQAS